MWIDNCNARPQDDYDAARKRQLKTRYDRAYLKCREWLREHQCLGQTAESQALTGHQRLQFIMQCRRDGEYPACVFIKQEQGGYMPYYYGSTDRNSDDVLRFKQGY